MKTIPNPVPVRGHTRSRRWTPLARAALAVCLGAGAVGPASAVIINGTTTLATDLFIDTGEQLEVRASGVLISPPISSNAPQIIVSGLLLNGGRIHSTFSQAGGLELRPGAPRAQNFRGALLEAHNLVLGSAFVNIGSVRSGVYTFQSGPREGETVQHAAFDASAVIRQGAVVENGDLGGAPGTGVWASYGLLDVQGRFANSGALNVLRASDVIQGPAAAPELRVVGNTFSNPAGLLENRGDINLVHDASMTIGGTFVNAAGLPGAVTGGRLFLNDDAQLQIGQAEPGLGRLRGAFLNTFGARTWIEPGAGATRPSVRNAGFFANDLNSQLLLRNGARFENLSPGEVANVNGARLELAAGAAWRNAGHMSNGAGAVVALLSESSWVEEGVFANRGDVRLSNLATFTADFGGSVLNRGQWDIDAGARHEIRNGSFAVGQSGALTLAGEFDILPNTSGAAELALRDEYDLGGNRLPGAAPVVTTLAGSRMVIRRVLAGSNATLQFQAEGAQWIQGGTLIVADGARVEHYQDSTFDNRGRVGLDTGASWTDMANGNPGEILFLNRADGMLLMNDASFDARGRGRVVNEGVVRLGPGADMTVRRFELRDGVLEVGAGATLTTVGDATTGRLVMTGGRLMGSGTINGDVFGFGAAPVDPSVPGCPSPDPGTIACFTPGSSPGTMTINGALTMGFGTVLELEIARDANGELAWDQVLAYSMSFADGALIRILIAPEVPGGSLASLELLQCGTCDFGGAQFQVLGGLGGQINAGPGGLIFDITPVPEPGTWALMLLGAAGIAARVRRARPASPSGV